MAAGDLGIPMELVLDGWVTPPDSVPVVLGRGVAVIRVTVGTSKVIAEFTAHMKRLAEAMAVLGDPDLVVELVRLDALEPATPANPEPGT